MNFTTGNTYTGFTLIKKKIIEEIESEVYLFQHDILKCPLLAVKNKDHNKTFAVSFNTIPTDSTGVAHILEHSVLMGSKKYPVKDVFGEIHKGGLMTFLNAMTGGDITYYPFATRNLKEYFNIMDVYCDVAFNPLLERSTFDQEGYHYHLESEGDKIKFQGVVYNEMKGAFSDPFRLIFHHIFSGLMPESTYSHESGGDPKNIPDLTYDDFCAFHQDHYHPSNATFFLYGDASLSDELAFLQDNFLNKYKEKSQRKEVNTGRDIAKTKYISDTYNVEGNDLTDKTFIVVGTEVSTVIDREENSCFQIIANILFNSDASPLKNKIVSSGLCKDFGGLYLSTSSYKTFMATYLVGSNSDRRDDFLKLYNSTLLEMVSDGIDRELILSELNKFEFDMREAGTKAQRGLDVIGKAMTAFKYNTDPFAQYEIEDLLKSIRLKALEENYFEHLIKTHLLENNKNVVITLDPDPDKLKKANAAEQERLAIFQDSISVEERTALINNTIKLQQEQLTPNSKETLALLPQLSLPDLETNIDFHKIQPDRLSGKELLISELDTNHITYLDIGFDLSAVPSHLLPWVNIFATIVTEIGTDSKDFTALAKEIAILTGGVSHSVNCYTKKKNINDIQPVLWFNLKCLPTYLHKSVALMAEIFNQISFNDRQRIKEIVRREFAWAEHSAHSDGYGLPASRIFSHLSLAGKYNEMISGITSYIAMRELAKNYDQLENSFISGLQQLSKLVFNQKNLIIGIAANKEEISEFTSIGSIIHDSLNPDGITKHNLNFPLIPENEAFITSAEVAFNIQAGTLLADGKAYNGHFEVLKTYLSRDYLWNAVRQMGGAYGCFIQFNNLSGNIALISYRDPQVKKTFDAYDQIPQIVADLKIEPSVLTQLIVGTYGNFDPHQNSATKASVARNEYLNGISVEEKLKRINEIKTTTTDDLHSFADAFKVMTKNTYRASIGNRAKIEKDKKLFNIITEL